MKNAALSIAAALLLAGCASSERGVGLYQLETSQYLRAERNLPMGFVQIQRAIFKQQARCDSALQFRVDDNHPSYARVTQRLKDGAQAGEWEHFLVLGLQLVRNSESKVLGVTLREAGEASTKAKLYSYYTPDKEQVQAVFNAILHPDLCPGETPPESADEKSDKSQSD